MRKILTVISLLSIVILADAQDMNDALRYSENNYYGTARTVALGNAFTALGGDLGSIGINPAGGAVNYYSQFVITPGLSVYSNTASFYGGGDQKPNSMFNKKAKLTMPNIGLNLSYLTGNKSGIKNVSVGMTINTTNVYSNLTEAMGTNVYNSMCGEIAASSTGINSSIFDTDNPFQNTNAPWASIIGWKSGIISTYGGNVDEYIGATESLFDDPENHEQYIAISRPLDQKFGRSVSGSKQDILLNFAINISDKLYLGANLGVTTYSYNYSSYIKEAVNTAVDPDDPELNGIVLDNGDTFYFRNARYRQNLFTDGTGAYLKVGAIFVPSKWVRLGAAIQTPTVTSVTEKWRYSGDVSFSNSIYNGSCDSYPEGNYEYQLNSPFIANFGVAITLGQYGFISADYEMTDYSAMKFRTVYGFNDEFDGVNYDIRKFMGRSDKFRIGAEFAALSIYDQVLSLRIGYNLSTNPNLDGSGRNIKSPTKAYSCGIGFSSGKSFFMDAAVRSTKLPVEFIYPYGPDVIPEIETYKSIFDAMVTIGWRF